VLPAKTYPSLLERVPTRRERQPKSAGTALTQFAIADIASDLTCNPLLPTSLDHIAQACLAVFDPHRECTIFTYRMDMDLRTYTPGNHT